MKKYFCLISMAVVLAMCIGLVSCAKDENPNEVLSPQVPKAPAHTKSALRVVGSSADIWIGVQYTSSVSGGIEVRVDATSYSNCTNLVSENSCLIYAEPDMVGAQDVAGWVPVWDDCSWVSFKFSTPENINGYNLWVRIKKNNVVVFEDEIFAGDGRGSITFERQMPSADVFWYDCDIHTSN